MTVEISCVACGAQIHNPLEETHGMCMQCRERNGERVEDLTPRHKQSNNLQQVEQENFTGFIVEVSPGNQTFITYVYDGQSKILQPNETFVGYFWQMTDRQGDGTFGKYHMSEIRFVDADKKLFSYGGEAVFLSEDVVVSIRALRGPDSNNRYLLNKFKKFETWNAV